MSSFAEHLGFFGTFRLWGSKTTDYKKNLWDNSKGIKEKIVIRLLDEYDTVISEGRERVDWDGNLQLVVLSCKIS